MKQQINFIYGISRLIIACVLICLPCYQCQFAGWLILDFCLALFFINNISNKKVLVAVILLQIIISLAIIIVLNTFTVSGYTTTSVQPNSF
ncbi:MAG: hypothetical protein ACOX32_08740 [Bacteroidaceae bacterium]|jgi:hypothetical protein|nr:hypothetical protein [Bacteroidales bacterium]